ncbi:MAG: hypothetical protein QXP56_04505 [Archaeoglobaceae archaeon]
MKTLHTNGVYLPVYSPIGLSIKYKGREIELTPTGEQMAIQFVKKFDTPYIQDEVFVKNFLSDFARELGITEEVGLEDLDFTPVKNYLDEVKRKTEAMSKEEKKLARELKKKLRETLKEKYGYAIVDGEKVPVQNWTVEPPSIFISKGKNPLRGRWKREIKKEEITLNLSPDAPMREQLAKEGFKIEWHPDEYWIAKWPEVFDPTRYKYVWLSPSSSLRQSREKKKYDLAQEVEKRIDKLREEIIKDLYSEDETTRKLATAVYLIMNTGIRVGDEKIAGERGTVGCTTLKPTNVKLLPNNAVHLDFTGKDFVHWERLVVVEPQAYRNLKELIDNSNGDYIFKGLNSAKVAKYLHKKMKGLTAKVFRTYLAGKTWREESNNILNDVSSDLPEFQKKFLLKLVNLRVAKVLNHKKALPKNFEERVRKKEEKLSKLREEYMNLTPDTEKNRKKLLKLEEKIQKLSCELILLKETSEWNLNTSLTSYIDPRRVIESLKKVQLPPEKFYSKSLLEKFSWAMEG